MSCRRARPAGKLVLLTGLYYFLPNTLPLWHLNLLPLLGFNIPSEAKYFGKFIHTMDFTFSYNFDISKINCRSLVKLCGLYLKHNILLNYTEHSFEYKFHVVV